MSNATRSAGPHSLPKKHPFTLVSPVTILMQAAAAGNTTYIAELLAAGVVANSGSERGKTPLMCAAEGGRLGAVALLLNAGADPAARVTCGCPFMPSTRGNKKLNCSTCSCKTRGWTAYDFAHSFPEIQALLSAASTEQDKDVSMTPPDTGC